MRSPFTVLVLALWLGLYAFRAFVPAAVWNLSDELPLSLKPLFAIGTHLVGLVGVLIVIRWRQRTLVPLAFAVAAVTVARQAFVAVDAVGPYLALAGWPLWLWFMAALADEIATHDQDALIAPAIAVALALQLGMQSAWHGLDLASVRGPLAILASVVLALLLCAHIMRRAPARLPRPHCSLAWLLLGPALFLELTLAGNAGRIGQLTGASVLTSVIAIQISLVAAVVVAERWTGISARIGVVTGGLAVLFLLPVLTGVATFAVLLTQITIIAGLREGAERRLRMSAAVAFTLSALLLMSLIFAFYYVYELPPLWIVTLAPLAVAAALARRTGAWPQPHMITGLAAACALAMLYLVPAPPAREPNASGITVLSYNIHHGFDDDGVPAMQRTVTDIAGMNADLVAVQEIGRGWTLLGGNDLVGYLRWRFPEYRTIYVPLNGQLWGVAVLTRLPVLGSGGGPFDAAPGTVRYGWASVDVDTDAGPLFFYSVHVTPDFGGPMGDERQAQVEAIQHVVMRNPRVVVAGDFNAHPQDPPIAAMRAAMTDLGAMAKLGGLATWPAGRPAERIDYIFGKGVRATGGAIVRTTASDHLPVLVHLRPDDTTAGQ